MQTHRSKGAKARAHKPKGQRGKFGRLKTALKEDRRQWKRHGM